MAGWLHGIGMSVCTGSLPRRGFSLRLFCNYFGKAGGSRMVKCSYSPSLQLTAEHAYAQNVQNEFETAKQRCKHRVAVCTCMQAYGLGVGACLAPSQVATGTQAARALWRMRLRWRLPRASRCW